jgi:hypothetical protein
MPKRIVSFGPVVNIGVQPFDKHRIHILFVDERAPVKRHQLHAFGEVFVFETCLQQPVENPVNTVTDELFGGKSEEIVFGVVGGWGTAYVFFRRLLGKPFRSHSCSTVTRSGRGLLGGVWGHIGCCGVNGSVMKIREMVLRVIRE